MVGNFYMHWNRNLKDHVAEFKSLGQDDLKFCYTVPVEGYGVLSDPDFISKTISKIQAAIDDGLKPEEIIATFISSDKFIYTLEEWEKIKKLADELEKMHIDSGFYDCDQIYSIREVENANRNISELVATINSKEYSPLEKLMHTYLTITSREYLEEGDDEHWSTSRSVYSVLNGKKIVCVGYSEWMMAVLNELKDPNIQVFENGVGISSDGKTSDGQHCNLIIHIKDEKYGLDGYYYFDPTWDSPEATIEGKGLAYFLVPIQDIKKINFGEILSPRLLEEKAGEESESKFKVYNGVYKPESYITSNEHIPSRDLLFDIVDRNPEILKVLRSEIKKNIVNGIMPSHDREAENLVKMRKLLVEASSEVYVDRDTSEYMKYMIDRLLSPDVSQKDDPYMVYRLKYAWQNHVSLLPPAGPEKAAAEFVIEQFKKEYKEMYPNNIFKRFSYINSETLKILKHYLNNNLRGTYFVRSFDDVRRVDDDPYRRNKDIEKLKEAIKIICRIPESAPTDVKIAGIEKVLQDTLGYRPSSELLDYISSKEEELNAKWSEQDQEAKVRSSEIDKLNDIEIIHKFLDMQLSLPTKVLENMSKPVKSGTIVSALDCILKQNNPKIILSDSTTESKQNLRKRLLRATAQKAQSFSIGATAPFAKQNDRYQ